MTSREGPVLCTWSWALSATATTPSTGTTAQPRQHRHHAAEQLERQPISVIIDSAQNAHHVDHCSAFHGGSSRDREVPCAVRIGSSSSSFRDVERNRVRCPAQLFSKLSLSAGNRFTYRCGNGHKLDRALVHIQLLKTQHAPTSVSGDRDCVAVAVADNAPARRSPHPQPQQCLKHASRTNAGAARHPSPASSPPRWPLVR